MPKEFNYKDEAYHDKLLISLTNDLDKLGRLDLLSTAFQIPKPGKLLNAQTRKPFDVELTFSKLSCIIETKVDWDEDKRWYDDEPWQTCRIVNNVNNLNYLKSKKYFFFITYGTSEYYTKYTKSYKKGYKNGPASPHFRHIKLDDMVSLIENALKLALPKRNQYKKWHDYMKIEQKKRSQAPDLLKKFSTFRDGYLDIHKDIDFPNNRFTFCAPELAFPVFYMLAEFWNSKHEFSKRFGRVAVYPIDRGSPPVHDSNLNFIEMWSTGNPRIGRSLLKDKECFFFEINEDFNLNLKLDKALTLRDKLRDEIWRRLNAAKWPDGVEGRHRQYKQIHFVLFEWDFGFLRNLPDYSTISKNLSLIIESAIEALK